MLKLDDNFLKDIGLGDLPAEQKSQMIKDIHDSLELRVGMKLAEQMTDAQLDEFEGLVDQKENEPAALKWLETNFPNYKEIVVGELNSLKAEIKASAPQILSLAKGEEPSSN